MLQLINAGSERRGAGFPGPADRSDAAVADQGTFDPPAVRLLLTIVADGLLT